MCFAQDIITIAVSVLHIEVVIIVVFFHRTSIFFSIKAMNSVEKSSGAFHVKMNVFWYETLFAAEKARAISLNSGLEIKKLPVIGWRERHPPKTRLVWGATALPLSMGASVSINSGTWEKWESQTPKLYLRDRKMKNYTLADVWKVPSRYLQALINGGGDLDSRIKLPFLTATLEANWNIAEVNSSCEPFSVDSGGFRAHFVIPCGLNATSLIYHVKSPSFLG